MYQRERDISLTLPGGIFRYPALPRLSLSVCVQPFIFFDVEKVEIVRRNR